MKFDLNKPVASNARDMDEDDIRNLKIILNRLGYYTPNTEIGITHIPDPMLFRSIQKFQEENSIFASGTIRPDDETHAALKAETKKFNKQKVQYRWKSVGDKKVRPGHKSLDGDIRIVGEGLEPGEEYGCRCWMTDIKMIEQGANTPSADN